MQNLACGQAGGNQQNADFRLFYSVVSHYNFAVYIEKQAGFGKIKKLACGCTGGIHKNRISRLRNSKHQFFQHILDTRFGVFKLRYKS